MPGPALPEAVARALAGQTSDGDGDGPSRVGVQPATRLGLTRRAATRLASCGRRRGCALPCALSCLRLVLPAGPAPAGRRRRGLVLPAGAPWGAPRRPRLGGGGHHGAPADAALSCASSCALAPCRACSSCCPHGTGGGPRCDPPRVGMPSRAAVLRGPRPSGLVPTDGGGILVSSVAAADMCKGRTGLSHTLPTHLPPNDRLPTVTPGCTCPVFAPVPPCICPQQPPPLASTRACASARPRLSCLTFRWLLVPLSLHGPARQPAHAPRTRARRRAARGRGGDNGVQPAPRPLTPSRGPMPPRPPRRRPLATEDLYTAEPSSRRRRPVERVPRPAPAESPAAVHAPRRGSLAAV